MAPACAMWRSGHDYEGGKTLAVRFRSRLIGLVPAVVLTLASFRSAETQLIYQPAVSAALITVAIPQMGVHLIFFLHLTTAPDNTNNVLAIAFGVLILCFVVFGSLWTMTHLNHLIVPMDQLMRMQK
jgi:cytochrome o ubiquinol oxidase operon protein cyoD